MHSITCLLCRRDLVHTSRWRYQTSQISHPSQRSKTWRNKHKYPIYLKRAETWTASRWKAWHPSLNQRTTMIKGRKTSIWMKRKLKRSSIHSTLIEWCPLPLLTSKHRWIRLPMVTLLIWRCRLSHYDRYLGTQAMEDQPSLLSIPSKTTEMQACSTT